MPSERQPVRFGVFEVHLERGEVRRAGVKVRMQEQPFQVLAALLEKPGEIVTKEELQERIWKDDTFVDFDRSLATAINKVRQALGDSATRPRFIETVAKRGYRFIGSAAAAAAIAEEAANALPPGEVGIKRSRLLALQVAAAVLSVALLGVLAVYFTQAPPERPVRRFSLSPPGSVTARHVNDHAVISPDGTQILFTMETDGVTSLGLRSLSNESVRVLPGTEGVQGRGFWSPDGNSVGFATEASLKRVLVDGGDAVPLCDLPEAKSFGGGSWSDDGERIVFSSSSQLYTVAARGGQSQLLLERTAETQYLSQPHLLPSAGGSDRLLYTALIAGGPSVLRLRDFESATDRELGPGSQAFYSSQGYILHGPEGFTLEGLWALPFSLDTLAVTGDAFPISEGGVHPSISRDGTLVFRDGAGRNYRQLVVRDRSGDVVQRIGDPIPPPGPFVVSPDGRSLAISTAADMWVFDLERGNKKRLSATLLDNEAWPVWLSSGREVSYSKMSTAVMAQVADGSLPARAIPGSGPRTRLFDWSSADEYIAYTLQFGQDIWYSRLDSDGVLSEAVPFAQTAAQEDMPQFSNDGRYLAYVSDESGRDEVYVRSFPDGTDMTVISTHGGTQPRWSADGKELFYVEGATLMSVAISTAPTYTFGATTRVFETEDLRASNWWHYDVFPDGQRFVTDTVILGREPDVLFHVVENWYEEFRDQEK